MTANLKQSPNQVIGASSGSGLRTTLLVGAALCTGIGLRAWLGRSASLKDGHAALTNGQAAKPAVPIAYPVDAAAEGPVLTGFNA